LKKYKNCPKKPTNSLKSHGNGLPKKKKLLYEGMKPKTKNCHAEEKNISGLGGSRTRDAHDRSLQTRRDAPVSIATRCIVGSNCSVYVRIIISNRPVTNYPKIEYIRHPHRLPSRFVRSDIYYVLFHPHPD